MSAHIAIIGAGPAGCAAAVVLAQRGMDVSILESRPFPRVKVCGEFISPAATTILESLLTPAQLHAARAQTVQQFHVEHRDRAITWRMPHPAWVLSRATLDDLLLARARTAGVRVIQPAAVREVCYVEHAVEVVTADAVLSADLVIHADGSGRHDPAGPTPMRAGVIGRKCHLRIPGGVDGLRMRTGDGAYVGLVQVEDGLATCALVARNHLVARHAGDGDALLAALWPQYRPEWRAGEWLSCGVAGD